MQIRTARLLLRRAVPDDVHAMHAILSDARAMRYWSSLPHTRLEQTAAWFEHMLDPSANQDQFVVECDGRFVGRVGMWRPPEIGFIFHPDVWGRGIASEALRAVIAHTFSAHPTLAALIADVDPRNLASLRLLSRVGFLITGHAQNTFLLGEEWCDSLYLALPRPPKQG